MEPIKKSELDVGRPVGQAVGRLVSQMTIVRPDAAESSPLPVPSPADAAPVPREARPQSLQGQKARTALRAVVGEEVFSSWFNTLEFESFDGSLVRWTVPVKFLCNWIKQKYEPVLLAASAMEFSGAERVEVSLRQHGTQQLRPVQVPAGAGAGDRVPLLPAGEARTTPAQRTALTQSARSDGSPLEPRYTFDSFVVGPANRMAHAGATQVAETVFSETRSFNPLFIHASVGLGKTHLLQAIAWEVRRRYPHANVLYITAERFRYQFVEALKGPDTMAFKDRFRTADILLVDDLEFMQGERTEQEFDHIINTLLDSGRQVVVAAQRAPSQIERMGERLRSRFQKGLVTEIAAPDYDLRLQLLDKRIAQRRTEDPSFEVPRNVLEMLAERLTESGRELEGAVARLYATWHLMHTPITTEVADGVLRDLVNGNEPRRIKVEDILRVVTRHYGVSKADILSQRRQRSIVWPRQIGMFLAKQMTSRSLPEIGRRFGNRDHTTVLHAIRKIQAALEGNGKLKDELDDLKRQING